MVGSSASLLKFAFLRSSLKLSSLYSVTYDTEFPHVQVVVFLAVTHNLLLNGLTIKGSCISMLDPVHTGPDPYGHHYQFEKSQDEHDS